MLSVQTAWISMLVFNSKNNVFFNFCVIISMFGKGAFCKILKIFQFFRSPRKNIYEEYQASCFDKKFWSTTQESMSTCFLNIFFFLSFSLASGIQRNTNQVCDRHPKPALEEREEKHIGRFHWIRILILNPLNVHCFGRVAKSGLLTSCENPRIFNRLQRLV